MSALLRDAIKPNLVQTIEGVPAFVHGGPFANIAHGTNSIAATRLALAYADAVVTEAGFAFELGAEKFFDINCRYGRFAPSCTVLVVTLRALKMHGGVPLASVAEPNPDGVAKDYRTSRSTSRTSASSSNAVSWRSTTFRAIRTRRSRSCVSIATFGSRGRSRAPVHRRRRGLYRARGNGVGRRLRSRPHFKPLYEWDEPIKQKILKVAAEMYGAEAVDYHVRAERDKAQIEKLGFGRCRSVSPRRSSRCPTTRPCWAARRISW